MFWYTQIQRLRDRVLQSLNLFQKSDSPIKPDDYLAIACERKFHIAIPIFSSDEDIRNPFIYAKFRVYFATQGSRKSRPALRSEGG